MKVVYPDGAWFIGDNNWKARGGLFGHETKGTHHFFVVDGDINFRTLKGLEVAVPVSQVKYFELNYKMPASFGAVAW